MATPPEILRKARQIALQMKQDGVPADQIDAYLKSEVNLGLDQVMSPDVADYLRSAGMGATFGFLDELAGAGAALVPGGKGYTEARDEVRQNYDTANAAATGADQAKLTGAEILGGIGGGLAGGELLGAAGEALGLGGKAVRATGTAAKALKGALTGAAAGGLSGYGYSDKNPAAGALGGAAGGFLLGGAVPAAAGVAKKVGRYAGDVMNPARAVTEEAGAQLAAPGLDPAATLARQEQLAPGTGLLADQSPETIALMDGVGADRTTAQAARQVAAARVPEIAKAREAVGQAYDQFKGATLTVTPDADKVLRANGVLPTNGQVSFDVVHDLRTALRERGATSTKAAVKRDTKYGKKVLDQFLENQLPGIREIDSRYRFLTERLKAAMALAKRVSKSSENYSKTRAYGSDAGSVGGSLPQGSKGYASSLLGSLKPNRADRARAAYSLLMTPGAPIPPAPPAAPLPGLLGRLQAPLIGLGAGRLGGGLLGE